MTSERAPGSALRWSGVLVIGLACGAAVVLAAARLTGVGVGELMARGDTGPLAAALLTTPVLTAVIAALLAPAAARRPIGAPASTDRAAPARVAGRGRAADGRTRGADARTADIRDGGTRAAAPKPEEAALRLLGLLQQEGRFVDFLEEDLGDYSDEQVGAAVRAIHDGCRTALRERLGLAPILAGAEGGSVTVERGFDPAAVRVTGNVRGEPPYHGVLRHPGWRSTSFSLPAATGDHDASILAPAEVEVL